MGERVIGLSGKCVEVPSMSDMGGSGSTPIATKTDLGGVIVGDNISVDSSGKVSIPYSTPSQYGVVQIGSRLTGGGNGVINVPLANRATAGVMKAGADLDFGTDGTINPYAATTSRPGINKQAVPVADVTVVTVTDVDTAAEAIAQMGTTLSELMSSLRNAGIL